MLVEEHLFWRQLQKLTMLGALWEAKRRAGERKSDYYEAKGDTNEAHGWTLKVVEAQQDWQDDQIDHLRAQDVWREKKIALLEAKLEQRDAKIALLERRLKIRI